MQFTGQGTKAKVLYKQIVGDSLAAIAAARAAGKRRLQVSLGHMYMVDRRGG